MVAAMDCAVEPSDWPAPAPELHQLRELAAGLSKVGRALFNNDLMSIKDEEVVETHRDLHTLAIVLLEGARLLQARNPKLNLDVDVSMIKAEYLGHAQQMHSITYIDIYRGSITCIYSPRGCMLHQHDDVVNLLAGGTPPLFEGEWRGYCIIRAMAPLPCASGVAGGGRVRCKAHVECVMCTWSLR
jgi:hypothetical protein